MSAFYFTDDLSYTLSARNPEIDNEVIKAKIHLSGVTIGEGSFYGGTVELEDFYNGDFVTLWSDSEYYAGDYPMTEWARHSIIRLRIEKIDLPPEHLQKRDLLIKFNIAFPLLFRSKVDIYVGADKIRSFEDLF